MRQAKWHDEMAHLSMDEAMSSTDDKPPQTGCNIYLQPESNIEAILNKPAVQ